MARRGDEEPGFIGYSPIHNGESFSDRGDRERGSGLISIMDKPPRSFVCLWVWSGFIRLLSEARSEPTPFPLKWFSAIGINEKKMTSLPP